MRVSAVLYDQQRWIKHSIRSKNSPELRIVSSRFALVRWRWCLRLIMDAGDWATERLRQAVDVLLQTGVSSRYVRM